MKSRNKLIFLVILMVFTLIGCSTQNVEKVDLEEVREYANPAAEKIFTGINDRDYDMFTEDFDNQMKAALTEEKFNEIVEQLGSYESKELIGADRTDGFTRVYYSAKFSNFSKNLTFTIVFSDNEDNKVSGLFYK